MSRLHLVLLIHAHQPVGNFDQVIEKAYADSYLPFLECMERHPQVRLALHYSGCLLEWMDAHHPEFLDLLRRLAGRNQIELVGGGFYEPILVSIPEEDRTEQIRRLADFLEKRLGRRPSGAWLAERVWEPQLPTSLAAAGVEYTLLDDSHFIAAGLEPDELHGYYLAEDLGAKVKLIPGLQKLRYLIPFRSVEDNLAYLRGLAYRHPDGLAAMGDDCEKFGVWPGTHEHCYTNGWLDSFFSALEANADWLTTMLPVDYLAAGPPLGRAYLPTASYNEMMEWALPVGSQRRLHDLQQEFAAREDVGAFLRGGFWRSFFSKYAESNLLNKKMLYVAGKVRKLGASARRGLPFRRAVEDARDHLLRAQCNDAYWHGIFGGLYSPHLRAALWREMIRAEKIADAAEAGHKLYNDAAQLDFDADGRDEILLASESYAAVVKPSDGGTLAALDFRDADVALINSLERRPEAAHAKLKETPAASPSRVDSIHDRVSAKEENLARHLVYDRWPRHAFRLLLFSAGKTFEDYARVRLEESATFAGGPYQATTGSINSVRMRASGNLEPRAGMPAAALTVKKKLVFTKAEGSFEVACDIGVTRQSEQPLRLCAGVEIVLNFLAPDAHDRYFDVNGTRRPLSWAGAETTQTLSVVDEWQDVAASIEAPQAEAFWVAPIETISISEEGFERVYQGSQILAVWPLDLTQEKEWAGRLVLRVARARH